MRGPLNWRVGRWSGAGILTLGFLGGLGVSLAQRAPADPPTPATTPAPTAPPSDYAQRPVALIYGNIMISREDLGEYLIAREGADKLQFLINKKIIEHCCKDKHIEVTAGEIDESLARDLKEMGNISLKDFEERVLKRYNKNLFEWKEDVIRPKLAMAKLIRGEVKVSEQDLVYAFEAKYGEMVEGRIIIFPKEKVPFARSIYNEIHDSEAKFAQYAGTQTVSALSAKGGKLDQAIARHSIMNTNLETAAFALREGEVSELIEMTPAEGDGAFVFKCDKRIPPNDKVTLAQVRDELTKQVLDAKTQQQMKTFFEKMRADANPKLFLTRYTSEEEWLRDIQQEIRGDVTTFRPGQPVSGN